MNIRWGDVGKMTTPGAINFRGYVLTVEQHTIDIWRQHPNAKFTVVTAEEYDNGKIAVLGTYELPEE